jgi:hypothetical protein
LDSPFLELEFVQITNRLYCPIPGCVLDMWNSSSKSDSILQEMVPSTQPMLPYVKSFKI